MLQVDTLQNLLIAADAFAVPLRMGDGFDEQRFAELCHAIREFGAEWQDRDTVPKTAAGLFVDLAPAIEACSFAPFYQGTEAQRIRESADALAGLVRECLAVPRGE